MNFIKGAVDGKVDKIIDQAAVVAKEKVGEIIGGDKKKLEDKKEEGGVDGASGKAATDDTSCDRTPEAMVFANCLPGPKN